MLNLIIFILASAGLSYGITQSDLLKEVREKVTTRHLEKNAIDITNRWWWFLNAFFNCVMCCGFYCGILVYLAIYFEMDYLLYPFIASITSYFLYELIKNLKSWQ